MLNVIEKPINEINDKKVGFTVTPEYVYKGKKLINVILQCSFSERENGSNLLAYYMSRYPKEFHNCLAAAKRSLELKCTQKALELLKARMPHE